MYMFKENNCRLCKKIFCCIKCRKKHEETVHSINPECDICLYGEIIIKNPIAELLSHIRKHHWPLHCKKCKRIFGSADELISHNMCPIGKNSINDISNKTPLKPAIVVNENVKNDSNYSSPPVMYPFGDNINGNVFALGANNFLSLTTSTPMQGEEYKCFLENMSGPITPVEGATKAADDNSHQEVPQSIESKISRKVTFNESPLIEASNAGNATNDTSYVKGCLKKPITRDNSQNRVSLVENTLYETAITDDTKDSIVGIENHDRKRYVIRKVKRRQIRHESPNLSGSNTQGSMWSSMASIVKTVLTSLSSINSYSRKIEIVEEENYFVKRIRSRKRLLSNSETIESSESLKRIKLTDIKCRRPINSTVPYKFLLEKKMVTMQTKSTQTDELNEF